MKEKTHTYNADIIYHAGGNPPVAAGLFDRDGNRLAWWPADYSPSQENMEKVVRLIWARDDDAPIGRAAIRAALRS